MQNSSNQDSHLPRATVSKGTHYGQERTFPWHTSATCPECSPIHLVRYRPSHFTLLGITPIELEKRKTWWKAWFRCYLRLSAQRTCSTLLPSAQETKISWHKSLTCPECAKLGLVYGSVQETYAERFLLHYCVEFCSPCITAELVQARRYAVSSIRKDVSLTQQDKLSKMCTDSSRAL